MSQYCHDCTPADQVDHGAVTDLKNLTGHNSKELIEQIDAQITALKDQLATANLVRKTLAEGDLATLPKLLQALINKQDELLTRMGKVESSNTINGLLALGLGVPTTQIGGGASDNLKQVLQTLVNKVAGLQTDVNTLKAGQPAASNLYVPHY